MQDIQNKELQSRSSLLETNLKNQNLANEQNEQSQNQQNNQNYINQQQYNPQNFGNYNQNYGNQYNPQNQQNQNYGNYGNYGNQFYGNQYNPQDQQQNYNPQSFNIQQNQNFPQNPTNYPINNQPIQNFGFQGYLGADQNQIEVKINQTKNDDDASNLINGLDDNTLRKQFTKKVFSILTTQLLCTVGFIVISFESEEYVDFMMANQWLIWVAFTFNFITYLMINCCTSVARTVPINYFVCFIFTLTMSYMVGAICVVYPPDIVLKAGVTTLAVCFALTLYAIFGSDEMTMCFGIALVLSVVVIVMSLFLIFMGGQTLHTIFCSLSALLMGIYLIFDVKMVVSKVTVGGVDARYSYDDYIIASVQIYYDIIDMFLEILQLMGGDQ